MPFDGTAISSTKVRLLALGTDLLSFGPASPPRKATAPRAIPPWHSCRRAESLGDTLALLARARELLRDERHWCRGSFARGWRDIPVPVGSRAAHRHCTLAAIRRAGRELAIPVQDAFISLEWQIGHPVQDWNDDPAQTHAEVLAAFDATIAAFCQATI
jgi:hypothetical protein